MELGWRGQKAWEKEFGRLQYQALQKATGTVQGTAIDKVNRMAGVEDVPTHMGNSQARFVARCVNDELAEEGEGQRWNDHGPEWVSKEGKKDGYISTLTRAVSTLPEGKPLWGGLCQKVDIEEVDLRPTGAKGSEQDPDNPGAWETEIERAGIGGGICILRRQPAGEWCGWRRSFLGENGRRA